MMDNHEMKIRELGFELPPPMKPAANYIPTRDFGNLLFTAGHGPAPLHNIKRGKVGVTLSIQEGYDAARSCVLNCLSSLKEHIGSLDRVKKIIKVTGFVSSAQAFNDQPKVINGASDFLVSVFGEPGYHARSAIGVYELPGDIPVEIELIVELK